MNETTTKIFPYLERLLDGEEVEWKTLGEVCDYEQPTAYLVRNTNYSDQYPIPVLTAGKTFILGYTNETTGIYRASEHPTILFDDFTTANKWVDFDFKAKSSAMKMLTSKDEKVCLLKYIFYWLNTLPADSIVGDHSRQWISNYAQKSFPVPPLRVQARIVEILDKFTQLEAELEAELEARNKQYDFYRNRLLDFALRDDLVGQVEWKTLGEVAEYVRERIAVDQLCAQTYVGVDNLLPNRAGKKDSNYLPTEGNAIAYQPNDILIGNIRPYLKKIWKADNEGGASADVLVIRSTTQLLVPGYLYHLLSDNRFFSYDMQHAKGAKMPRGNKEKILDYVIPLPPLSEQRRIVDFLDRFDTLTNSISEGLPREIALRRKQYEYYRDALLRFPQPAPTA